MTQPRSAAAAAVAIVVVGPVGSTVEEVPVPGTDVDTADAAGTGPG
jgi:hypothetical protein